MRQEGRQIEALRTFDSERDNIETGFWNAAEAGNELAVLYPIACQPFFSLRLHLQEVLRWLDITLPLSKDKRNTATLLNTKGLVLRRSGSHSDARACFQEALATASDLNSELEGTILGNLGHEFLFLGDLEQASVVLERAYSIALETGDSRGEIVALAGLERLYAASKDFSRALGFAYLWLEASRRSHQRQSEGEALGNMGITFMHLDEPEMAIECFEADLRIARELGDRWGEAACTGNLGWVHAELGDSEKAIQFLETRISMSHDLGDVRGEAESSWALGWVYEELGDLARASELLQVRLDYQRAIDHPEADATAATIQAIRARIDDPSQAPPGE